MTITSLTSLDVSRVFGVSAVDSNCLKMPDLRCSASSGISFLTDDALFDACGVRITFTGRIGGVSVAPYDSLNLGSHVGDDPDAVAHNRLRALDAIGAPNAQLITLDQVHGSKVLSIASSDPDAVAAVRAEADSGADAIVVCASDIAPMLCFADCVPVIAVSPSGNFAVVHAGWRGVMSGVARKAVIRLSQMEVSLGFADTEEQAARSLNIYIGPHIRECCFETGVDVRKEFEDRFGAEVLVGDDRVDLSRALTIDLESVGADPARMLDCGICTVCSSQDYFSYRASGGTCGRHAAMAVRIR